jgi:signal transduction histidine kinase
MKIRTRLAYRFALIVAAILLLFSISILYFASINREDDFNIRIRNRARTTARLLLEVGERQHGLLKLIDKHTINALYDERISIYSDNDSLIYHHEESGGAPIQFSPSGLDSIREENGLYRNLSDQSQLVAINHKGRFHSYVIIASARDEIGLGHIRRLGAILLIGGLTSLFIAAISGWLFAQEMLYPVARIIREVESITASSMTKRLNEGKKSDEVEQLAVTFNQMLDRLQDAFEMQRRFVSNASHELRTPLTAVMGVIDVTLMKEREQQEYVSILRSVQDEMKKLTALTNGLLKLAQVSSGQGELTPRMVRIDELLWSLKEDLGRFQPECNMIIDFLDFPENEEKMIVRGNESLLRTAFLNLTDNACKYSADRKVSIKASFENGIVVRFIDKGRGIPKKDLRNVLQPFYRADNSADTQGHGLGLSLADRIIRLHNGSLMIESEEGVGTEIIVSFNS